MSYGQKSEKQNTAFLPTVSVVIPIYNGEEDLPELITCLRSQTYPSELTEFWLVDNNSNDNTAQIIQADINKKEEKNNNLYYLKENQIQSSYAARNKGIKASSGEIIAFTDADCRPQADWLKNLIQPFINPKISIVVGEIEDVIGNNLLEKYAHQYKVLSQQYSLENSFCPYGQTANLAIRKQVFYQVGLFRPYLTTGGDADICWRILQATETEIEFAAQAIILHRHRNNLKDFQNQWRRYGNSNFYLHKLHGLELMKECDQNIILYRLSMWFIKELPKIAVRIMMRQANFIDVIKTPIDLIRWNARTKGQQEAKMPEEAYEIESLS